MILKKLVAQGFKSFADRTEFVFDHGVTAIVGPNGCGKSNVVDAIRWVLGEQSAKSLRGKQMMDVIFNGSGSRKSGGMAQVDLVFDNTDGTLALDQTEVTVTRRLYRSGESEYLLNKQSCRLKDIKELLMDTGIGIDAYSVIEQGRVDAMLQANPVERRIIFEEAAGISKFKARKKEAQRKLERVEQNLLRLQDVIDELEKRLRSIKLAAGKARNYQEYSHRLRELRSRYALATWVRLTGELGELEASATELGEKSTRFRDELATSERSIADAQERGRQLEHETQARSEEQSETQSRITGSRERISAAEHRIEEQTEALERLRQRCVKLEEIAEQSRGQLAAIHERGTAADEQVATLQAKVAELQEAERATARELIERQQAMEDEKSGIVDLLRRTSTLNNEVSNLSRQQTTLAVQKDKLAARDAEIAGHLGDLLSRRTQLEARRNDIIALIDEQAAALEQTAQRAADNRTHKAQIQEQLSAAREFRSGLQARQSTLEELDRSREGLRAALREVLAARDADMTGARFNYVLGPIGELLEVDSRHAGIIEAVLGEMEQHLVVTSRDALLSDRDSLNSIEGRVQALCLDGLPHSDALPDLTSREGVIACAADWVTCGPNLQPLVRHLLGRTVVVDSIDRAVALAAELPTARFVTTEGVLFEPDGRIALGSLGAGTGIISRRSELREIQERIGEAESRLTRLEHELAAADSDAAHLEKKQNELRAALGEAKGERVEADTTLRNIENEVQRLSRERPLILSEAEAVAKQMNEAIERERQSKSELENLETTGEQRRRRIDEIVAEIEEKAVVHRGISEQVTEARVAMGEAIQRKNALAESLRTAQAAVERATRERAGAERESVETQQRIEQSRRVLDETSAELAELEAALTTLTAAIAELREQRQTISREMETHLETQRRIRIELEAVDGDLGERRIRIGQLQTRVEDLEQRTRDEMGVELCEQPTDELPDDADWSLVESEIEDLRRKIERLGNVNIDAIAEQEELEKNVVHKIEQRDDLRESDQKLRQLIETLDQESVARFRVTFDEIRKHFGDLFRKLFGGGRADVMLQDDNDILECGIDIIARPPGKEPRSITQLSGGEKTMTAIAMLMAVFRSRPSPFTLLDEVDAALDEANNERFNHVVREFLQYTQFIIITHSKRTMSIADVLYGVTMQEAGVSTRVAVRLEEAEEAA